MTCIKITVTFCLALILSGCAALGQFAERHPVVTAIAGGLVVGSIAATAEANGHGDHQQNDPAANQGHKPCTQRTC
jgi:hypothetical protein